jgi:hypothetical protein
MATQLIAGDNQNEASFVGSNDGAFKVRVGPAGAKADGLSVSATGVVTTGAAGVTGLDVSTVGQTIGIGQTWQNMTGSRALGSTYTNNTGKPIQVYISCSSSSAAGLNLSIGGLSFNSQGQATVGFAIVVPSVVVPAGATYSCTLSGGTASNLYWLELR